MKLLSYLMGKTSSQIERQSFALNQLDKRLEPYLMAKKSGFFIEAGANNGIRQSNTLYFEKYHHWTGLLIEPIPELAEQCRHNRPHCLVENFALVSSDYPSDNVEMVYCNLMSVVKGGMSNEDEQKHIQSGEQFLSQSEKVYITNVPVTTLSTILDKHQIERIDLLSLDVEGYEAQALRGLDLDRHRPEFMLIEVRSKEEIESVISNYYEPIAVLHIGKSYSDILYRKK